jgi:NAD(P) transhydrogenase subunit alpha
MKKRLYFGNEGRRVVLTPEVCGKILKKWENIGISLERGAGVLAGALDGAYEAVGVEIAAKSGAAKGKSAAPAADLVLKIGAPCEKEVLPLAKGGVLVCLTGGKDTWDGLAKKADNVIALERLPRTSRAQAMDVLSSQANLGGYAAVLGMASRMPRLMPQMMTAAGSVKPANILVLGVGVAGLQAIATAKRLGAVVWAFDVRPEVAEQSKSLGGKVVELETRNQTPETSKGQGGYAGAMDEAGMKELQRLLVPFIAAADGVVSTAQVPGRAAPVLISEEAVAAMKPGAVIVDMAAGGFNRAHGVKGGNCPLTVADEVVVVGAEGQRSRGAEGGGVTIIGETDWPSTLAADASKFWAGNMFNLLGILLDKDGNFTFEDELVKAMLVVKDGSQVAW